MNSTNVLSVTKSGAGRWILTGANTYKGATTLVAGTLGFGAGNQNLGALLLAGDAAMELGSGTVSFADSSSEPWENYTLSLTGTLDENDTSTLRIGTDSSGLTSGQLAKMK